jgi:hypothetical protein
LWSMPPSQRVAPPLTMMRRTSQVDDHSHIYIDIENLSFYSSLILKINYYICKIYMRVSVNSKLHFACLEADQNLDLNTNHVPNKVIGIETPLLLLSIYLFWLIELLVLGALACWILLLECFLFFVLFGVIKSHISFYIEINYIIKSHNHPQNKKK